MLNKKYIIIVLFFVLFFNLRVWPQVSGEQGKSWKYLIERKITDQNKLLEQKEEHLDRAFIYYGKDSEKAGGQVKNVPQVVYIDSNDTPLNEAEYFLTAIQPLDPNKFGLIQHIIYNIGEEPNLPAPADGLQRTFSILPFKPVGVLQKGLSWNRTIYTFYGEVFAPELVFPTNIEHNVREYEILQGRRCAVIDYIISGDFLLNRENRDVRAKYILKGKGTAYYDPNEEIIVKKVQTITWERLNERVFLQDNGQWGWRPDSDYIETVEIKILLQSSQEELKVSGTDEIKGVVNIWGHLIMALS